MNRKTKAKEGEKKTNNGILIVFKKVDLPQVVCLVKGLSFLTLPIFFDNHLK